MKQNNLFRIRINLQLTVYHLSSSISLQKLSKYKVTIVNFIIFLPSIEIQITKGTFFHLISILYNIGSKSKLNECNKQFAEKINDARPNFLKNFKMRLLTLKVTNQSLRVPFSPIKNDHKKVSN